MSIQKEVRTVKEIGEIVAATRISQGIRFDELNTSHVFVGELEKGKETAQIGKVLQVLNDLGIRVILDVPPGVELGTKRRRVSK